MPTKPLPSDLPIRSFSTATDFEHFLESEHASAPGIYAKFAKKSSGITSISAAEAVEIALCFGWIDGRINKFNDDWWLVRYTPRRPKSIWSQKNVITIGRLLDEGRMRPAGIVAVKAAKADGRWERAYAGSATIEVPKDFAAALQTEPAASAFFESMNRTDRYSVLWRVQTASPSARAKRIEALVEMLKEAKKPGVRAESVKNVARKRTSKDSIGPRRKAIKTKTTNEILPPEDDSKPRRAGLRKLT
ncbi:MAG: hypothetical protein Q9218_006102 [Villophora microphyllina]